MAGADGTPTLLERVAAGDRDAVRACIDAYGKLVWALALRYAPTAQDAEDAVQDIFIELWQNAGRYRPDKGSEPVFIATIARRRLIDRMRRSRRRPRTESLSLDDGSSVEIIDASAAPRAEAAFDGGVALRALGELEPLQRRVVLMSAVHGYSHGEIVQQTGLALGTVKTYIRRGLIKVRLAMGLGSEKNRARVNGNAPRQHDNECDIDGDD